MIDPVRGQSELLFIHLIQVIYLIHNVIVTALPVINTFRLCNFICNIFTSTYVYVVEFSFSQREMMIWKFYQIYCYTNKTSKRSLYFKYHLILKHLNALDIQHTYTFLLMFSFSHYIINPAKVSENAICKTEIRVEHIQCNKILLLFLLMLIQINLDDIESTFQFYRLCLLVIR